MGISLLRQWEHYQYSAATGAQGSTYHDDVSVCYGDSPYQVFMRPDKMSVLLCSVLHALKVVI